MRCPSKFSGLVTAWKYYTMEHIQIVLGDLEGTEPEICHLRCSGQNEEAKFEFVLITFHFSNADHMILDGEEV